MNADLVVVLRPAELHHAAIHPCHGITSQCGKASVRLPSEAGDMKQAIYGWIEAIHEPRGSFPALSVATASGFSVARRVESPDARWRTAGAARGVRANRERARGTALPGGRPLLHCTAVECPSDTVGSAKA
ncbi:MAG: hypothetical protein ABR543_05935 [Gemmatimonadaceae bacterium]